MSEQYNIPLPARLLENWIEDNTSFIQQIKKRTPVDKASERQKLAAEIRICGITNPCQLGAIDAASIIVPLGDMLSVLLQVVAVNDGGVITLGKPQRATGIDSHELRLAATPMRVAAECEFLSQAKEPTIADTSYWSFLMEVNQAITRSEHSVLSALQQAVSRLVDEQIFLKMIRNPLVFPMSKTSESETFSKGVSDRQFLTEILEPGEYIQPRTLTQGTSGSFGIEKRRFRQSERTELEAFFKTRLGVTFYKPHPWSRAYRIEGHMDKLNDQQWLQSLFTAINLHTAHNRCVIEPWPQFMADYTAKTLSGIKTLYGELNWHRTQNHYIKTRT